MKKITFIAAITLLGSAAFTSCKKDYHCTCTYNGNTVYDQDLGNTTHKDAENQCNEQSTSVAGQTWSCKLD